MRTTRPAVTPPVQRRSQATLDRILAAAARLLDTRSFDELTLVEVVAGAECSVGAFYGRFRDKDALLHALDERYFTEFEELIERFLASDAFAGGSIETVIRTLADRLADFHLRQRGLLRALILHARVHGDPGFRSREMRLWKLMPRVASRIAALGPALPHANPGSAVVFAVLQLLYALREMTLWPGVAPHMPVKGAALSAELARSAVAYLTTPAPRPTRLKR